MNNAWLCVNATDDACADLSCSRCSSEMLGSTYCDGNEVRGCFVALNDLCGLVCEQVTLRVCPSACFVMDGTPDCHVNDSGICSTFACDVQCPPGIAPGETACVGGSIVACAVAPVPGAPCGEICVALDSPCPAGQSCQASPAPVCIP
jgi:hypothetical protein